MERAAGDGRHCSSEATTSKSSAPVNQGLAGTGEIRSQVVDRYTDNGIVDTEWQSHSGEVITSNVNQSPSVQYGYDATADANGVYRSNIVRPQHVRYPDGRVIHYQYGTAVGAPDDVLSRISHIREASSTGQVLAQYSRLGSGQIVKIEYPEPQLSWTLAPRGNKGEYDGMDCFGRTKDLLWYSHSLAANVVHVQQGYDAAGRPAWREDRVAKSQSNARRAFPELYRHKLRGWRTNADFSQTISDLEMAQRTSRNTRSTNALLLCRLRPIL